MFHVLTLATRRSCFSFVLGRSPPDCLHPADGYHLAVPAHAGTHDSVKIFGLKHRKENDSLRTICRLFSDA